MTTDPRSMGGSALPETLLAAVTSRILVTPQLKALILKGAAPEASREQREGLVSELAQAIWLFCTADPLAAMRDIEAAVGGALELCPRDVTLPIVAEPSVVQARRETTALGLKLGFGPLDRTKIATAASELARNVLMYAKRGELRLSVRTGQRPALGLEAVDQGPGIPNVQEILSGAYRSRSGLGLGLRGVKAIAQEFRLTSAVGQGTRVFALFEPVARKQPTQPTSSGGRAWR